MSRLIVCLLALLLAAPALAQAPDAIPVTGTLADANGAPLSGTISMTFALYGDAEGTQQLWSETQQVTLSEGGVFSARLGASASVDLQVFADYPQVMLGVTVESDSEMPLIELGSVPWAGYAAHCGTASGLEPQAVATVATQVQDSFQGAVHDRYTDDEAVAAMGPIAESNPLNHNRMTQSDVVSALGGKGDANSLNHDRYTDAEAVSAMSGATVNGDLTVTGTMLGGATNTAGTPMRVCSGSSPTNGTGWVQYNADGIYINVDTSGCGFTNTPVYTTGLYGGSHWTTSGVSSIYNQSPTGFRVYVRYAAGGVLSTATADNLNWHVQWIAVGN